MALAEAIRRRGERGARAPHIGYVTRDEYKLQFNDIFDQILA